jgi:intein/homing endonuclease
MKTAINKDIFKNISIRIDKNGLVYVKGSHHRINLPVIGEDLALFLGIMWGDGWAVNRKIAALKGQWRLGIVEDDKIIIDNCVLLSKRLFGVPFQICDRKTKYEAYLNSKIIYEILTSIFKFPDGEKKGKLRIPAKILQSRNLIIPFLRGLFSTDGKFVLYKNYPRIELNSATLELIKDVEKALKKLGFAPTIYTWKRKGGNKLHGLYLNGENQVKLFYKKINFIGRKYNKLEKYIKSIAPASPVER